MSMKEYKDKSVDELKAELIALRQEQFNLRMQAGAGQTIKTHLLKAARRNIARIKTLLTTQGVAA